MGLGIKRTCLACSAKFYDLDKKPIICPKCSKKFDVEDFAKPKRGRKKVTDDVPVVDDVELGEEIELLDDEAEEAEDVVLPEEEIELEDENAIEELEEDSDRLLVELEEENDDIIESDDGREG